MALLLNPLSTQHLASAQPVSSNPKQGAEFLKTDILGVFAHPDDETGMAATLASYALGRRGGIAGVGD